MNSRFLTEPLTSEHDRRDFVCGQPRIDDYFQKFVSQDVKRGYATCFVAIDKQSRSLIGFYTLSASSIPLTETPREFSQKLPRYPTISAALIGWLAIDHRFQRQQLGSLLIFDAITRVRGGSIGAHVLVADAIDERATAFYRSLGFIAFRNYTSRLFLPISDAVKRLPDE